jgi:uncharacterized protein (TIRG00374 family)
VSDALLSTRAAPVDPEPDQTGEPGGLKRRLLKPQTLVSFAIAIAIVVFLVARLNINLHDVWNNIRHANPWMLLGAFAIFYFTFVLRAIRWRGMLVSAGIDAEHGYNLPGLPRILAILLLSWFANCIVPAKLGDGYRCFLLRRDTGARFSATLGTILAERLTDLVVLFTMMSCAGLLAFHGSLPSEVTNTLLAGIALIVVGVVALSAMMFGKDRFARFIPERFKEHYEHFHTAVFACLRRPILPLAVSIASWFCDGLRVFLVAHALGANLSYSLALFVALMSALLTTLPFTPAGLGVVEAAIVVVLKLVDVQPAMAGSIAVIDRVIGYWSLILVGTILYVWRLKTELRVETKPATR